MQGKNWAITINNYTESDIEEAKTWDVQYLLFAHEVGKKGTPHVQGLVQFKKNMRAAACKKLNARAHWEICRRDEETNQNYCLKDGNILLEIGELKTKER